MPPYAVRFERAAADRVATLGKRDRETVAENIAAIRENPRCFGSHPCGLNCARLLSAPARPRLPFRASARTAFIPGFIPKRAARSDSHARLRFLKLARRRFGTW